MNIYVSNLEYNVTEADLKKLFAEYGEVSGVKIITDYDTGQSRGFAFVEMPNDREGQRAIDKLNNTLLNNRPLSVQQARPKQEKPTKNFSPDRDKYRRDNDRRR